MTDDVEASQSPAMSRHRRPLRRRLPLVLAVVLVLLIAVLVVPPMVSISRYKSRITELISASLGRPVRLSSVELRLLPWPGFVLTDLSVAEDPAYGAEPVLHANTVKASIRLLSLWRGRLDIGDISMDEASLNLVRSAPGRWNLDPLFRTAAQAGAARGNASRRAVPRPSLEATNSRINVKNGAEKLPFSLINTDIEFWQENPDEWRIRLRGQPARTDVSLYQEDTGVMRLEATVHRAPVLSEMPMQLDLDWREAQLGQLARLITGSDPGWRGDLTGNLHLEGTADAARISTRLRATGVHRAEFAPAEPMDFDANCNLVYHYAQRALENLDCNSPLGDGRVRLTGNMPNEDRAPHLTLEMDRIPIAAGLDALRTLRSDVPADLGAKGTISGKIAYAPPDAETIAELPRTRNAKSMQSAVPDSLSGALNIEGLALSGGGLNSPVQIPKIVLQPVSEDSGDANASEALAGTVALPAGGSAPLAFNLQLTRSGYQVVMHGPASLARAKVFFDAAGLAGPVGLDSLAGDPISVDLTARGPWLQTEEMPPDNLVADANPDAVLGPPATRNADTLSGTVTVRNANWRADFLANHVQVSQATLHLGSGEIRWDPVAFVYGPVKGTASLTLPVHCAGADACVPHFHMHFGNVDAATLQSSILGAQQKSTLISALIDRLHPSSAPPWPQFEGDVQADSLVLGPVALAAPSATLHIRDTGAEITDLRAKLLGGRVLGSGSFTRPANDTDKPAYTLECSFENLDAKAVGKIVGQRWSGSELNGNGKIDLSGYTDRDLAHSAKGTLHFEWHHGSAQANTTEDASSDAASGANPPAALAHFDLWTADAAIGDNTIKLGENQVRQGRRKLSVEGVLTFADSPEITFTTPEDTRAAETPSEAH
jgi:hypothetical protein